MIKVASSLADQSEGGKPVKSDDNKPIGSGEAPSNGVVVTDGELAPEDTGASFGGFGLGRVGAVGSRRCGIAAGSTLCDSQSIADNGFDPWARALVVPLAANVPNTIANTTGFISL
jgi:hypothetical protein